MNTLDFVLKEYGIDKKTKVAELYRSRNGFPTLFRRLGFRAGAQIGVAKGYFSKHLSRYLPQAKIYSIDAWKLSPGSKLTQEQLGGMHKIARSRLSNYPNNQIVKALSMDAVKRFDNETLDFVYVDEAHDYRNTYNNIKEWSRKVKPGGIIAGNNYVDPVADKSSIYYKKIFDVKHAVNDWVRKNGIKPFFLLTKGGNTSWFYVKKQNA